MTSATGSRRAWWWAEPVSRVQLPACGLFNSLLDRC
jgi:hypothetical protein